MLCLFRCPSDGEPQQKRQCIAQRKSGTPWVELQKLLVEVKFKIHLPKDTQRAWDVLRGDDMIDSDGRVNEPLNLLWSIIGDVGYGIVHGEGISWVDQWEEVMEVLRVVVLGIPTSTKRFGLPFHILVAHFRANYLDIFGLTQLPYLVNHFVERCHQWDKRLAKSMVSKAVGSKGIGTYAFNAIRRCLILRKLYSCGLITHIPD